MSFIRDNTFTKLTKANLVNILRFISFYLELNPSNLNTSHRENFRSLKRKSNEPIITNQITAPKSSKRVAVERQTVLSNAAADRVGEKRW